MCLAHHQVSLIFRSMTSSEKVLLGSVPLSLSEQFIQQVTLIFESMTGFDEVFLQKMLCTPTECYVNRIVVLPNLRAPVDQATK